MNENFGELQKLNKEEVIASDKEKKTPPAEIMGCCSCRGTGGVLKSKKKPPDACVEKNQGIALIVELSG